MIVPAGFARENGCECGINQQRLDPIPDTILGLNIKEACCIHDWMYGLGNSESDRSKADKVFLWNLLYLIQLDKDASWKKTIARRAMAYHYYAGLVLFGGVVYWRKRLT